MSTKKVFLSSTARDLKEYREAAYGAIEGRVGYHCVRMEDFGARDWDADEFCRTKVGECDLFVGILGHLYGSCPKGSGQSYTEREYDAAVEAGIPILMFDVSEGFPTEASMGEPEEKFQRMMAFRERVRKYGLTILIGNYTSPRDLAGIPQVGYGKPRIFSLTCCAENQTKYSIIVNNNFS